MAAKKHKKHKMEKLYPIIRRARRPLLPPDEIPPSPQVTRETAAAIEPSSMVEPAPADSMSLPTPPLVLETATPPKRRRRKESSDASQAPAT